MEQFERYANHWCRRRKRKAVSKRGAVVKGAKHEGGPSWEGTPNDNGAADCDGALIDMDSAIEGHGEARQLHEVLDAQNHAHEARHKDEGGLHMQCSSVIAMSLELFHLDAEK